MCIFTLAISCLTTYSLPWFMDLTFQVPMKYCSLQHWTFLSPPETSTTGCCFCVSSASYFLLELFLLSSPVEYWTPTDLGSSSFIVISFCIFILFMGFSRQECWSGLPFPCPADHVLSELSIMNCPNWVALQGIAHSFIELDKAVIHVISLVNFCDCGFHSVFPLMDEYKRLVEASWWKGLAMGKAGSWSGGQDRAQYIFNPIFCDGWGCVPSL